jgi:hypothetical protein
VKKQIKLFNNILHEKKSAKRNPWIDMINLQREIYVGVCWLSDQSHHFSMVSILNKS